MLQSGKHHHSRSKDDICQRKNSSPLTFLAPKGGAIPDPNETFPCSWDMGNTSGWQSTASQDLNSYLEVSVWMRHIFPKATCETSNKTRFKFLFFSVL